MEKKHYLCLMTERQLKIVHECIRAAISGNLDRSLCDQDSLDEMYDTTMILDHDGEPVNGECIVEDIHMMDVNVWSSNEGAE